MLSQHREIDALLTTLRESLALDEGLTSEAAISALTDLRSLLSRANVLAETTDAFTRRFFDEFIQDGLEITVGEIPEAIRVAVDTEGVLLNVDPDAVVGFDAEGALVAVDPTAEVAVEETELPVQETEQPVEEKEQPIDPNAEVPVDTEGKTVDVDTADKTIPIGDLPAGTLIPIEALPPGTVVPIEDLPADVQIQFAGVPEGTLIPIENLPPGTLIPIQALPPELVIPFAGIIEGTVIPFGGVPETESVPFAGVPADTEIGVEDTSEREIAVEDTSDRTITVTIQRPTDTEPEPPAGETPQTLDSVLGLGRGSPTPTPEEVEFLKGLQRPTEGLAGLAGGSAVPSQGEVQLLAELALLREIGEADSQQAVEIKDQLLVGLTSLDSSISEELMTRFPENTAAVQSVTAELMQQIPPVVLSLGTVNASVATGLKNVENSVEKPVDINSLPPVKGEVGVNRLPPVVIQGGEITIRGGSVNIRASETIPVRVENISDLITDIDDTRAQSPAGDFDDPFAG